MSPKEHPVHGKTVNEFGDKDNADICMLVDDHTFYMGRRQELPIKMDKLFVLVNGFYMSLKNIELKIVGDILPRLNQDGILSIYERCEETKEFQPRITITKIDK